MYIMWIKARLNSGTKLFFFCVLFFIFLSYISLTRSSEALQTYVLKEIPAHICQKQNLRGCDVRSSRQWGTRCRLPQPSAEITGDMSKWDRVETRRVGQVVNTLQLHALHWFSAHVDAEFKCIYVIRVKCFPGLHVTHREEGVAAAAGESTCGR